MVIRLVELAEDNLKREDINDYVLKFHEDFYNPIIDEVKYSTIRDEPKPIDKGDYVFASFKPSNNAVLLRIIEHYAMKLKDLTRKEVHNEGYLHKDILKHELHHIYPNLKDDDYVYIYLFERILHKHLVDEFKKEKIQ